MFKKVSNWHLSILIIIVSILCVSLAQKYVLAAWQEPTSVPGGASNQNIVLNPMTVDLNLNGRALVGSNITMDSNDTNVIQVSNGANICFGGTSDCRSSWPVVTSPVWNQHSGGIDYVSSTNPNVGIGIANPSQLLQVDGGNILVTNGNISLGSSASIKATKNAGTEASVLYLNAADDVLNVAGDGINFKDLSGNNLLYIDDVGSFANVGIGTTTPNKSLHIATPVGINAEIDISSGANSHWGMYQDETSGDLRFWNNNDNVVFDSAGYVGIGTTNPTHQLQVESVGQDAIYAKTQSSVKYGLYAENAATTGVAIYGLGQIGVVASANQSNGMGILATQGIGEYAGYFVGDVQVTNGYFQFPVVAVDPPSSDCNSTVDRGKAVFNSETGQLVICNFHKDVTVWDRYDRQAVALP